jgi:hypothetical protein
MGLKNKDLCNLTVVKLKKVCKILNIVKYSKLRKDELVYKINTMLAILKLQRHFRNKWINGPCPISMEPIGYPCFSYKPKGSTTFIYYNLDTLVDYLLQTGDFRDPKTREPYSDETLKAIDKYKNKAGLISKSVYKASCNRNIYRRKKEHEDDIMVLERYLDEIVSSIRGIMETENICEDRTILLNSYHFPTFLRYYKKLLQLSKETANYKINNTIQIISGSKEQPPIDPYNLQDFILQFFYTIEVTYFDRI